MNIIGLFLINHIYFKQYIIENQSIFSSFFLSIYKSPKIRVSLTFLKKTA